MKHELSSRTMTPAEASTLKRSQRLGFWGLGDDLIFVILFGVLAVLIGITAALGAGWLASSLGFPKLVTPAVIVALIVSALAGVYVGASYFRWTKRTRRRVTRDVDARHVEVIRVHDARIIEQEAHGDEGPLYFIGIGGGKVLYLGGQWLYDCDFYAEDDEEVACPATSFTLHRLASGTVLGIEGAGGWRAPEAELPRRTRRPAWVEEPLKGFLDESMLLEGDFRTRADSRRQRPPIEGEAS